MQGTISKIVDQRGFGFIKVEDQAKDIFFHRSQIGEPLRFEELKMGQVVEFELEETPKGPQAINIRSP